MASSGVDPRPAFMSLRLRAEPVEPRHAAAMAELLADPRIHRFLPGDPPTCAYLERQYGYLTSGKSPDGTEHWLTWILLPRNGEQDDGGQEPVGYVQATIKTINEPEVVTIAYVIGPAHWRRGLAREAIAAMLDTVFARYGVRCAVAEMDTRNEASIRIAESLGFRRVDTVFDAASFKGSTSHEHVYHLTRAEWSARR
jgi:[ribosomal protein S5]-alanine N-acetyltransferase